MSPTVTLRTFFRATDDASADALGAAGYVAGFEPQNGEPWGVTVPLGWISADVSKIAWQAGNKRMARISETMRGTLEGFMVKGKTLECREKENL